MSWTAEGEVAHVDDLGTVHVRWDDGAALGMVVLGSPPDRLSRL